MSGTVAFERERRARLANMRQELLAPVSALVGYGEMLLEEAQRLQLAPILPDLERILTSARDLLELVDRLLDVGNTASQRSAADLGELQAKLRHDLRNPLNAIKGYAELLLEDVDELDAQTTRSDLEQLLREAESLRSRIDGIVDFSGQHGDPLLEGQDYQTIALMVANLVRTVRPVEEDSAPAHETGRILVVDDNGSNRDLLFRRLSHDGHQVTRADSGGQALEILKVEDFDLILLDLLMPDLNGFQVLKRLKSDERLHDVPVIMISGLQEADSAIRCIEAGAEDYLPKPFNPVLLRARISASLERKRWRDRERRYVERIENLAARLHARTEQLERKTRNLAAANAQIEQELETAQNLQQAILPQAFPRCTEFTGYALMRPARQLAGDFYDVLDLPNGRLGVLIADVSDKGVPAAFFMGISRTVLHSMAQEGHSPGACLARANDVLCRTNPMDFFVTVFYGILNPQDGTFLYANGGHNPPLLVRNGANTPTPLEGTGSLVLGALEGIPYPECSVRLEPGDALLLYTDGVTEAQNAAGEEFAEERLISALAEVRGLDPAAMVAHVSEAVRAFTGGAALGDDLTCLVLCYVGAAALNRSSDIPRS